MQRRQFLSASLAASAAAMAGSGAAQAQSSGSGEFYQIRAYHVSTGPQIKLMDTFFSQALIPALSRMGTGPIGTFRLEYGAMTPTFYVLIPGKSVEALAMLDLNLAKDEAFVKDGDPVWHAPAAQPAFDRVEYTLTKAMAGWPKLAVTPLSQSKQKRIFQLRTYESPSYFDHIRKVEMFNSGEFDIFEKTGCNPVFFSDTIVGSRMPSLTYMLSFTDLAALDKGWDGFRNHPAWKKLTADQRFAFEPIVSNVSNLILSPLPSSQL